MESRIPENLRLLGLVVTTIPFDYIENQVMAQYNGYIEVSELENLKTQIEDELKLKDSTLEDSAKTQLRDDIYFIDKIIEFLKSK